MSKVFVCSETDGLMKILETTPAAFKSVYYAIKESIPTADLGVYGAKDIDTLRRMHHEMLHYKLIANVDDFIQSMKH